MRFVPGCLQEGLLRAEAAYNASLGEASKSLPALVDRLMFVASGVARVACLPWLCIYFGRRVLATPAAWISSRCTACLLAGCWVVRVSVACPRPEHAGRSLGSQALSFYEARDRSGGHEVATRINLLAARSPDAAVEIKIDALERKRSKDEAAIFLEARGHLISFRSMSSRLALALHAFACCVFW
jgi:hypothetical protein